MGKAVVTILLLIGVAHVAAILNLWYFAYPWIDIPMHFVGGAWAVVLLFWIFRTRSVIGLNHPHGRSPECHLGVLGRGDEILSKWLGVILALSFAAFIGVLWEFFEFFFDVFISSKGYMAVAQLGTADTMKDLFFDLLGGLFAWAVIRKILLYHGQ
ncbi:hypothetical protein A3A20_01215 [Candidatus Wolfebacteria bacterium RIFCSPLOWO2_01_FULL_45_19]|uniref:VanZ-like domain-containing protein n=1 Tax=Candidatus Wolfebacteria bacterium RIFCSPLOWO2_01_FULL_45_19 TaxID=1802557 RepID=A0A1F8DSF0_9BACT|nr:MAG: hypothetical protein UX23_C0004G0026 [Parcubacteria group bacterium GW2011_GWB1_45_9]OGM91551.1 MAG: hypothetical protein A3A20_01215 [Candidatus Wolfebacteria bacterium RIFCSPLOWO2_01_FULL_45_19]